MCYLTSMLRTKIMGLAAYGMWGTFPLYFTVLDPAGPVEILLHRVVWTMLVCAVLLTVTRTGGLAGGVGVPFTITDGAHWNAFARSNLTLNGSSGEVVQWQPYDQGSLGQKARGWLRFAHTGELGGLPGQVVAGLGCLAGLALAWASRPLMTWLWPAELPPLEGLRLSGVVLALSVLLTLAAVVLVSLAPARVVVGGLTRAQDVDRYPT